MKSSADGNPSASSSADDKLPPYAQTEGGPESSAPSRNRWNQSFDTHLPAGWSSWSGHGDETSQTAHGKEARKQRQRHLEGTRSQSPSEYDVKPRPEEPFVSLTSPNFPRRSWSPSRERTHQVKIRASISASTSLESSRLTQWKEGSTEMGAPLLDRGKPPPQVKDFRTTPLKIIRKKWQEKEITQSEPPPAFKKYALGGTTAVNTDRRTSTPPSRKASSSSLQVDFVPLNIETEDTSDVKTYNKRLESIAQSQSADKAQSALNVLATMSRNGVDPNESTWGLVEQCSDIGQQDESDEHLGIKPESVQLSLYTADGQSENSNLAPAGEGVVAMGGQRRKKSAWKMEQDLTLVPPAFRASLLAMLRKREENESRSISSGSVAVSNEDETTERSEQQGSESLSVHSDTDGSGDNVSPDKKSISKPAHTLPKRQRPKEITTTPRKQKSTWWREQQQQQQLLSGADSLEDTSNVVGPFQSDEPSASIPNSEEGQMTDGESNETARRLTTTAQSARPESILLSPGPRLKNRWAPPKIKEETPAAAVVESNLQETTNTEVLGDPLHELYLKHGVPRYMRPDGYGEAALKTWRPKAGNTVAIDPEPPIPQDVLDLERNNRSLLVIAESDFPDKAKKAGDVLKSMKANLIKPDEITRILLEKCSGFERIQPLPEPPLDEEDFTTPTGLARKKVTFSETNQVRIIRRRRSISTTERWDDPLTPPKRTSALIDLADGRFSCEPRDDRPSLPRRSDSMSSLLSAGSDHSILSDRSNSSDRTSTSSSSDASIPDSPPNALDPPSVPTFKLPFEDSPTALRKKPDGGLPPKPPRRSEGDKAPDVPPPRPPIRRRLSISGTREYRDAPLTPPRRVSAPLDFLVMKQRPKSPMILSRPTSSNIPKALPRPAPRQPASKDLPKPPLPPPKNLPLIEPKRPPLPNKIPLPTHGSDLSRTKMVKLDSDPGIIPVVKYGSDHGPPRPVQHREVAGLSSSSHDALGRTAKDEKYKPYSNTVDRHEHVMADAWSVVDLPDKARLHDARRNESSFARVKIENDTATPGVYAAETARRVTRRASIGTAPSLPEESVLPEMESLKLKSPVPRRVVRRRSVDTASVLDEESGSPEVAKVKLRSTAATMKKSVSLDRRSRPNPFQSHH
jgi:hypothetical protein